MGDRVVVPFPISCGQCFFCRRELYTACERSNPNGKLAEEVWGHVTGGIYGYSEMLGGYCPAQRYLHPLAEKIERGEIDTSFVVTHRTSLDEAPAIYEKWNNKEDGIVKAVLRP